MNARPTAPKWRTSILLAAAASTVLLLPACRTAHRPEPVALEAPASPPGAIATVADADLRRLLDDVMAADNAGDVDAAAAYFTEDALMLPPDRPEVSGRDAIRSHYVMSFRNYGLRVSATAQEIRVGDGWGVIRGTVQGTLSEKSSGKTMPLHDKFVAIAERGTDGRWRFARMIWSPVAKAE